MGEKYSPLVQDSFLQHELQPICWAHVQFIGNIIGAYKRALLAGSSDIHMGGSQQQIIAGRLTVSNLLLSRHGDYSKALNPT